jgi:hypothetical protein
LQRNLHLRLAFQLQNKPAFLLQELVATCALGLPAIDGELRLLSQAIDENIAGRLHPGLDLEADPASSFLGALDFPRRMDAQAVLPKGPEIIGGMIEQMCRTGF